MATGGASRGREWLRRYGPAEILSLAATLGAAAVATRGSNSEVARALAATWAGNLAYFGYLLGQDVWHTRRAVREQGRRYSVAILGRNIRALVVEFGVAEVFDSLFIRPALLYWLPRWLHSVPLGVLAAKLAADVTFYIPTIISYELSKQKLRKF